MWSLSISLSFSILCPPPYLSLSLSSSVYFRFIIYIIPLTLCVLYASTCCSISFEHIEIKYSSKTEVKIGPSHETLESGQTSHLHPYSSLVPDYRPERIARDIAEFRNDLTALCDRMELESLVFWEQPRSRDVIRRYRADRICVKREVQVIRVINLEETIWRMSNKSHQINQLIIVLARKNNSRRYKEINYEIFVRRFAVHFSRNPSYRFTHSKIQMNVIDEPTEMQKIKSILHENCSPRRFMSPRERVNSAIRSPWNFYIPPFPQLCDSFMTGREHRSARF